MTQAIQDALDIAKTAAVRVVLLAGRFACRGLVLRSDTDLQLTEGAVLAFEPDYDAYASNVVGVIAEDSDRAMITAKNAANIAITGPGRIEGQGSGPFSLGKDEEMGTLIPRARRPRVLVMEACTGVRLQDLHVTDSPMWTLHFVGCQDLALRHLRIENALIMPNTDGIVLDGCQDVVISQCRISTADDGVVLKTSRAEAGGTVGPCLNISVTNCTIESRSCALKIGTESYDDFRNIRFEDCTITGSNRGLGIFSRDGGVVEDIRFADLTLTCQETPEGYWGSGEALTITLRDRRRETPAGDVRRVVVENCDGLMEGAINLVSDRPGGISDVALRGVALRQSAGGLGTAERYDMRPGPADLAPSPDAAGRANAWCRDENGQVIGLEPYPGGMPALFAKGVLGLTLEDVSFDRPAPLPDRWNPTAIVEHPQ